MKFSNNIDVNCYAQINKSLSVCLSAALWLNFVLIPTVFVDSYVRQEIGLKSISIYGTLPKPQLLSVFNSFYFAKHSETIWSISSPKLEIFSSRIDDFLMLLYLDLMHITVYGLKNGISGSFLRHTEFASNSTIPVYPDHKFSTIIGLPNLVKAHSVNLIVAPMHTKSVVSVK